MERDKIIRCLRARGICAARNGVCMCARITTELTVTYNYGAYMLIILVCIVGSSVLQLSDAFVGQ